MASTFFAGLITVKHDNGFKIKIFVILTESSRSFVS